MGLKHIHFLIIPLFLIASSECHGQLYYFTDAKGTIHLSNAPADPRFNEQNKIDYLRKYRQKHRDDYEYFIKVSAEKYSLDPLLVEAVIEAESNFDCYALSHKGAAGLMQLMPGTADDMDVKNTFNARQNIDGGSRYLRKMLDSFNQNLVLALAAYNAGPNNVKKFGKKIPPFPETKQYVKIVLRNYQRYKKIKENPRATASIYRQP